MKLEFVCHDPACAQEGGPYVYRMEVEAVMDEKNLAAIFCPRCHRRLESRSATPDAA